MTGYRGRVSRILGGRGKGRRLKAPAGHKTRPSGSRVRQTLFDILAPEIPGCRFLDAFAGTGGVGLEALSRGAARAVLVDTSASAVAAIRENVAALRAVGGDVQVFRQEARVALTSFADRGLRFDIVYLDPPYESDLYEVVLEHIGARRLLDERGLVVVEHFHKRALPETIGGLRMTRSVRVGDHRLSFYRWRPDE